MLGPSSKARLSEAGSVRILRHSEMDDRMRLAMYCAPFAMRGKGPVGGSHTSAGPRLRVMFSVSSGLAGCHAPGRPANFAFCFCFLPCRFRNSRYSSSVMSLRLRFKRTARIFISSVRVFSTFNVSFSFAMPATVRDYVIGCQGRKPGIFRLGLKKTPSRQEPPGSTISPRAIS